SRSTRVLRGDRRMSARVCNAALMVAVLGLPVACAGLDVDHSAPLPFKVAIIPFEPTLIPEDTTSSADDGDSFEARFDPVTIEESLGAWLAARFTEAVVLRPPPGMTLADFLRRSRSDQDSYWIHACADAEVDLVLDCDAILPDHGRHSHNEAFWLNLPIFFIG